MTANLPPMELFENHSKGAIISECGKYRYQLWRIWNDQLPKVLFIMLNPSTADANEDDPTIRRCIAFAKSWGYGGLFVGNLFAYRSTNPSNLKKVDTPIGPWNTAHVISMFNRSDKAICAWGNGQSPPNYFKGLLPKFYYLELSKDGIPKHPLYLKGNLQPKRYEF